MIPLRLLLVEDDENDAALLVRELSRGGYAPDWVRVDDEPGLRKALSERTFDLVVADHAMPRFSSLGALAVLRSVGLDLPFIIVSGSIPEDLAVSAMRAGAHDFLTKARLARLVPVVERELRDARGRARARDAERRLKESEARYRRFFEDDLTGDVLWTADGRVLDCNPAFVRIFGFASRAGALDATITELWREPERLERLLERVRSERLVEGIEVELRRQDGAPVFVVANLVGEFDEQGRMPRARAYFFDVTRRRELEEQLRHSQRMEAVGRLAGGVAHDFNNLLCAVTGYTQLTLNQTPAASPVHRFLVEVGRAADRAALLTRRLLSFSRKQVVQPEVLDVGAVVTDLEDMLRRLIREDITLRLTVDREAGNALLDRGHVEQVAMNFVVNARDAIGGSGTISIETSGADATQGTVPDADVPPGRYVLLSVSDDGAGMSPEVMSHVFEPFFTTKPEGEGTGLGLATVHGIVMQSHGHVRFESAVGRGTTFRVYWPVVDAPVAARAGARDSTGALGHGETILLVEDNATVRGALVQILSARGYRVLEASDGPEGLETAQAHPGPIAALVTDVVMPQLHGPELAERLRRSRPDVRVLFLSAYADELADGDEVARLDAMFLAKPFHIETLLGTLRELLTRPARPPSRDAAPAPDARA